MKIRPATPADAEAIVDIHVRSWQHAYRGIIDDAVLDSLEIESRVPGWRNRLEANDPPHTLVAERDGEVIGFAGFGRGDEPDMPTGSPMLYSIYLHPDAMGGGVGSALLRESEQCMEGDASLRVLTANAPTRTFYERHGWQPEPGTERMEHWYGADMETIRYRKHIK